MTRRSPLILVIVLAAIFTVVPTIPVGAVQSAVTDAAPNSADGLVVRQICDAAPIEERICRWIPVQQDDGLSQVSPDVAISHVCDEMRPICYTLYRSGVWVATAVGQDGILQIDKIGAGPVPATK